MRKDVLRRHSGQSMVEFAVLAPVFFMLLLGTIDLGRAVYIYNSISDAAREGARAAIPFDSPLPTRSVFPVVSVGSSSREPTASVIALSIRRVHVTPPLVLLYTPPCAAPTYTMFAFDG